MTRGRACLKLKGSPDVLYFCDCAWSLALGIRRSSCSGGLPAAETEAATEVEARAVARAVAVKAVVATATELRAPETGAVTEVVGKVGLTAAAMVVAVLPAAAPCCS